MHHLSLAHRTFALLAALIAVAAPVMVSVGCTPSHQDASEPTNSKGGTATETPWAKPVLSVATSRVRGPTAPASNPHSGPSVPELDISKYPWHGDDTLDTLAVHDDLLRRVREPDGFVRVKVEPGSFGAWLRRLPLAAPGTPVLSYRGGTILRPDHQNLTAVATIDVGKADLQQCADAIMRLHGEWKWSAGERDMSYRAASGEEMPYARWERGERVVARGQSIGWVQRAARSKDDHGSFRKYMDAVFAWSNTVALARQAKKITLEQMRPGDFMVLPGNPGHTVLVLDMATDATGKRAILLGQSYMPAQSFHVLRPSGRTTWFTVDPQTEGVQTPFWPTPFPWSSLRRLD